MEYLLLALVAGAMGVGWWWLGRRRKELLGDSDDPASLIPREDQGPPEVITREALVNRSRRFDPSGWDDTPDAAAATPSDPDELPTHFDRSYLERTGKRTPEPGVPPGDPVASPPAPAAETEDDEPMHFDRDFLARLERERAQRKPAEPDLPDT